MRARYYDPGERRFTQEDPIGYAGGVNLYAYVDGQVTEARDPSGTTTSLGYQRALSEALSEYMSYVYEFMERGGSAPAYYFDGVPVSASMGRVTFPPK